MSSASSNQLFVRDGAGYEELYPSGCRDPDELSERIPSATSPSSKNEDMELAKLEEGFDDEVDDVGVYEQALKAGLRFPLNTLKRELLQHLGLLASQISPNAWRVFIVMEVLYGAMSDGSRSLTIREFLHCYRPDEIDKSNGMYSFALRKSVLKVIYETPDSSRDWKSRYFFLEGDGWMCHPGEIDYIPVDKTWGILGPSGISISIVL